MVQNTHTNVSNFETASPKTISTLFCDNLKIPSRTYYLKEAEMKIALFGHLKEYQRNHKKVKTYMTLGDDAVSKLETFVWIFKHISRFIA